MSHQSEIRRPRVLAILGECALWLAAVLGFVCILLVILAFTMNITLILFRTGSMSPSIPAGSLAVVREIPAADIALGDVITVDRAGELPVTHRVTSVTDGSHAASRMITMRGDANAADDPFPYEVTQARRTLFSVPGIAPGVAAMGNPIILGSITVAAAALVFWTLWPRSRESAAPAQTGRAVRRHA